MAEYKIIRQVTWIFKTEASSKEEALKKSEKIWDDDLMLSNKVIYHEITDNVIEES